MVILLVPLVGTDLYWHVATKISSPAAWRTFPCAFAWLHWRLLLAMRCSSAMMSIKTPHVLHEGAHVPPECPHEG
eukprot:545654-Hanusia_phi.AAC.3